MPSGRNSRCIQQQLLLLFIAIVTYAGTNTTVAAVSNKIVTVYATYGYLDNDTWRIPMRIWVKKRPDKVRRLAARGARRILRRRANLDDLSDSQKRLYMTRVEDFVTDSESREHVKFVFDKDPQQAAFLLVDDEGRSKTDFNGLLEGTLTLSRERARELIKAQDSTNGWLTLHAVSRKHSGRGHIQLIDPVGHSVISDIDDTIKVTEIPSGEATVLRRTFFQPFEAAPCMAMAYQSFAPGTVFHYVSGGPWQMYAPLSHFLWRDDIGFPRGSVHMKNVRTNPFESESYQDLWKLIGNGSQSATVEQKMQQISTLFTRFHERTFTLIGDSGEADPEVFSSIRDQFGNQVAEIRIRDVVDDATHRPQRLKDMTVIKAACDDASSSK